MSQATGTRAVRTSGRERWLRLVQDEDAQLEPRLRVEWLNHSINVTLASLALVIVSPIMLVLATLVKLTSRGPVFYTQTRVGQDRRWRRAAAAHAGRGQDLGGRVFVIYKFRTMCVNAEHLSGAVWATRQDPRVTLVGRFMRQYRLDELPQLINVLKGDMNLVGPRPERPSIFLKLRETIPNYHVRQRAKPGITGLAQINQAYDGCLDDVKHKLEYDLEYLRRQSVWEDLRILFKTVPVVLFKRGGW